MPDIPLGLWQFCDTRWIMAASAMGSLRGIPALDTLGLALIVWLTVQVFTLPEMVAIQFILYALAALLIALPLLPPMRDYFRLDCTFF
jgi:hypothetical protein